MDKLKMTSNNKVQQNIADIQKLFPNAVTEVLRDGKPTLAVDFDVLRQEMSDTLIDDKQERYQFTWPDKKKSVLLANSQIFATLRPCKEESVDFANTQNVYIEGDNLDVLKLLRETYLGKIKMIYIDPPYNTGNDFVYEDDFAQNADDYVANSGQSDSQGNRLFQNTESNGRFHTDWLNMIYPRIKIARDLLSDDGIFLASIDDNEQSNLKKVCDEIFGENNFVGELIHQRAKGGGQAKYIVKGHDYILVYGKNIENVSLTRKKVIQQKTYEINGEVYIKNDDVIRKQFGKYDKSLGDRRCFYEELIKYKGEAKKAEVDEKLKSGEYFLEENDEGMHTICKYEKVEDATSKLYSIIKVLSEEGKKDLENLGIVGFSYPKPVELLTQLIEAASKKDSIILDFFSGSATTAHATMLQNINDGGNRKFIMVQLPEICEENGEGAKAGYKTLCDVGEDRIRRAGKKIKEEHPDAKIDTGFRVFKLDSSNMQNTYYNPAEVTQSLLDQTIDNIKTDRSAEDLLFQVMLDLGLPLSAKVEEKEVSGHKYFTVNGNDIVACFADNIDNATITEIAKLQPLYAVFKDRSFATDSVGINNEQIFKTYSPATQIKVL